MRAKLLLAALLIFGFLLYTWPQDAPPSESCAANHRDAKKRCTCATQDPEGCRDGKRTRERNPEEGVRICKNDCYMQTCRCCLS